MVLSHCRAACQLLSRADVAGTQVADLLDTRGLTDVQVEHVETDEGATDFVKARVIGRGSPGPTLGVIGRLGGVGARPNRSGLVSDADGAIVTVATALALADLQAARDDLCGRVILTTHVCPRAPVIPHEPVPFMGSPVDQATKNRYDVDPAIQAVLSADTTRGNRLVNQRGFAITPTVMQGWILRVSEALLDLQTWVSGRLPLVLPLTTQDVTPCGNACTT